MCDTFKRPFLERVQDAVDGAMSIGWEGCHKIYVARDLKSHDQQTDYGYEMLPVKDVDSAVAQLFEWWERSCGLRFIQVIEDGDFIDDAIGQFEYEEEECDA